MTEPRWPLYATLLGSAAYIGAIQIDSYHPSANSAADAVVFVVTAPLVAALSVALGLLPARLDSLLGAAVLTAALQWGDPNPFPAMITIGFWLVGVALRSDRHLARDLRRRAEELQSGREAYIHRAVRYEHIRMARELHDIVAHNLSVIVIQARAGARLTADDPAPAELLETIVELTDQVHADLDALASLLAEPDAHAGTLTRHSIQKLLAHTEATGSPVTCQLPDDLELLPGAAQAVVYRVVEEGLTNAIKHAPGAPIHITIGLTMNTMVVVTNSAARQRTAHPPVPGAGRGITGLTERVHGAGGTFTSGPTPQGGWQLRAELPA